jgi:hypothetical protein
LFPAHTATSSRSAWSSRRSSGNARAGTAGRTASRGHGTRPPGTLAVVKVSGNTYSRIGSRIGVLELQSDSKGGLGLPQHSSPFLIDRPLPPVSRRLWPPRFAPILKTTVHPRPATNPPEVRPARLNRGRADGAARLQHARFPPSNIDAHSDGSVCPERSGRSWPIDGERGGRGVEPDFGTAKVVIGQFKAGPGAFGIL